MTGYAQRAAYLGYAPPVNCTNCKHPGSDHFRGHLACLHSTAEETWACSCAGFGADRTT